MPLHGERDGMGDVGTGCRDPMFSGVVGGGFEVVNEGRRLPPGIVASGRGGGRVVCRSRGGKGSRVEYVPIPLKCVEFNSVMFWGIGIVIIKFDFVMFWEIVIVIIAIVGGRGNRHKFRLNVATSRRNVLARRTRVTSSLES